MIIEDRNKLQGGEKVVCTEDGAIGIVRKDPETLPWVEWEDECLPTVLTNKVLQYFTVED